MWAITKKELKNYFLSPIGYIYIGVFLLACSLFFYLDIFAYASTDFSSMFGSAVTVLTFIVPLLTMRMFAEERKNGTEQLILTSPISITKVVLGKLVAALGVILITLIISLGYYAIVSTFAKTSIIPIITSMVGFMLVSMAAISVGMFASSITENQVISAIITIAFLLMSIFMENINEIFSNISLIHFYEKFPSGLISWTEVAGLVSFSLVFILLTILVMQRRKTVK